MSTDFFDRTEAVRTDVYCHQCKKTFIARIDMGIDGQHVINCPFCNHEHCRKIEGGKVTGDRWDGRNALPRIDVPPSQVWNHTHMPVQTSAASHFIRDRWLNRSDM